MSVRTSSALGAAVGALALAATLHADTIDFEGLANGLDVESTATPFAFLSNGITSTGANLGAAIFDTDPNGPNAGGSDPDLLVDLGNMLILQSTDSPGQSSPNIWGDPNDEADGGIFFFDFDTAVMLHAIDLVDIDGGMSVTVSLFDGNGGSRIYDVPANWTGDVALGDPGYGTLDLTTVAAQAGFGSIATAIDLGLDPGAVTSMTIAITGSGGIDNLVVTPTPSALALLVLGAVARRRRRHG